MKKIIYIWFATVLFSLSSCSDILDITPTDRYSDPLVWQDQNLIKMFVNEQYNGIANKDNFYYIMFYSDDNYSKYHEGGVNYIQDNILTSDNINNVNGILNSWDIAYNHINNINTYFKNIPTSSVDETFKANMTAEIKFIRAYIYAKLIWAYGGVPIIEQVYTIDSDWSQVKRNSWDECVTYILKDLDDVINSLPDRPAERNRASANAARALKARVLLYDASPLNNPSGDRSKWQAAADIAESLFDKGYALSDDYRKMFLDPANSEFIFAKEFNDKYSHLNTFHFAPPGGGGLGWLSPSQNLVDAYETIDGEIPVTNSELGTVNPNSMYNPVLPYKDRDPRFYATVYHNGSLFKNREVETFKNGIDMQNQDATFTGYYLRKFVEEDLDVSKSINYTTPFPFSRLAEIYLNYAEAKFHLGDEQAARKYVNMVRARKGVNMPAITESGSALLDQIYHERFIELAFEGHRFFDVRRWKIADKTETMHVMGVEITKAADNSISYRRYKLTLDSRKDGWKDAFYRLPIKYSEIQKSNNSIKQNPGYN